MLRDAAAGDDVVQETFTGRKAGNVEGLRELGQWSLGWLLRITHNLCIDVALRPRQSARIRRGPPTRAGAAARVRPSVQLDLETRRDERVRPRPGGRASRRPTALVILL